MTTLEIVMMAILGLIFPGIWYLQKRLNDIERDYADRREIRDTVRDLKHDLETDFKEIKESLKTIDKEVRRNRSAK